MASGVAAAVGPATLRAPTQDPPASPPNAVRALPCCVRSAQCYGHVEPAQFDRTAEASCTLPRWRSVLSRSALPSRTARRSGTCASTPPRNASRARASAGRCLRPAGWLVRRRLVVEIQASSTACDGRVAQDDRRRTPRAPRRRVVLAEPALACLLEFIQFHPTRSPWTPAPSRLGRRPSRRSAYVVARVAPFSFDPLRRELGPRDVVARGVSSRPSCRLPPSRSELRARVPDRRSGCRRSARLSRDLIPVAPAAHYTGEASRPIDERLVPRLYAIGGARHGGARATAWRAIPRDASCSSGAQPEHTATLATAGLPARPRVRTGPNLEL